MILFKNKEKKYLKKNFFLRTLSYIKIRSDNAGHLKRMKIMKIIINHKNNSNKNRSVERIFNSILIFYPIKYKMLRLFLLNELINDTFTSLQWHDDFSSLIRHREHGFLAF